VRRANLENSLGTSQIEKHLTNKGATGSCRSSVTVRLLRLSLILGMKFSYGWE